MLKARSARLRVVQSRPALVRQANPAAVNDNPTPTEAAASGANALASVMGRVMVALIVAYRAVP